ncbi:hypothetical protein Ancab_004293 [Ancistrocladus abbreviatus]
MGRVGSGEEEGIWGEGMGHGPESKGEEIGGGLGWGWDRDGDGEGIEGEEIGPCPVGRREGIRKGWAREGKRIGGNWAVCPIGRGEGLSRREVDWEGRELI